MAQSTTTANQEQQLTITQQQLASQEQPLTTTAKNPN